MNPWGFIAASYAVTAVVLVALVLWVTGSGRAVTRRLAELDARGIKRRSAPGGAAGQR